MTALLRDWAIRALRYVVTRLWAWSYVLEQQQQDEDEAEKLIDQTRVESRFITHVEPRGEG